MCSGVVGLYCHDGKYCGWVGCSSIAVDDRHEPVTVPEAVASARSQASNVDKIPGCRNRTFQVDYESPSQFSREIQPLIWGTALTGHHELAAIGDGKS
jgi:hypothetical protein